MKRKKCICILKNICCNNDLIKKFKFDCKRGNEQTLLKTTDVTSLAGAGKKEAIFKAEVFLNLIIR